MNPRPGGKPPRLGEEASTLQAVSNPADTNTADGNPSSEQNHRPELKVRKFQDGELVAGRFRVVQFIDSGGMGEVYEVEDQNLQGVRLALKTILPHVAADPGMQHRFEREVLLARRVVHPHLCPIYDIFHCQNQGEELMFLTMKLLPGENLATRLKRSGPLDPAEARAIVEQVAGALAAAHDAGILHRDIKTANIMLDGSGPKVCAWVTDFGLARGYQTDTTVMTAEGVPGTPGYVAPELFLGEPPSTASDVYALGVVVYKMLTGAPPPATFSEARGSRDPLLQKLAPEWRRMLTACLEPAVDRRCQTIPQALDLLHGGTASKRSSHLGARRLSRRQMMALGAGAAAGIAAGVWFEWPRIDFAMHPLPTRRFVALLDWPTAVDAKIAPMISSVVDAIGNELSRAEAFDHDLLVIPHHMGKDAASLAQLNDVRESLGANLVMAASAIPIGNELRLLLQVLDPAAGKTLREITLSVSPAEQMGLPSRAVRAAARLLGVKQYGAPRDQAGTTNPEAYQAFQNAEALRKKDNDSGLEAAVEEYKRAVEIDPRYARAMTELSWAYLRTYGLSGEQGPLRLALQNCTAAIRLDDEQAEAHLALAYASREMGDNALAWKQLTKALAIDPKDAHTLTYQANFYAADNRWREAEDSFQRVISLRPNYWLGHQQYGVILDQQGKYPEALVEFQTANYLLPKNYLALKNVGGTQLQLGRLEDAGVSLHASDQLKESDETDACLAELYRVQRQHGEAVKYALRATKRNPNGIYNWLELGDCYSSSGSGRSEAVAAYKKGAELQEAQLKQSPKDGLGSMLLAVLSMKSGQAEGGATALEKAESLKVDDVDSQMLRIRVLALAGRNTDALEAIRRCMARGPMLFQMTMMPDLEALRASDEYQSLVGQKS